VALGHTYQAAGVDIDAAARFEAMIKERIASAWPGMEREIGKFAGGGPIPRGARNISISTDGVGTKILLEALTDKWYDAGKDAAAMGLVDVYVSGSNPLYMVDTFKAAKLQPELHIHAIEGLIDWCKKAGCVLVGGETAELPGMFAHDWIVDLDVTVVGFPSTALTYAPVEPGQQVYGWPSHGPASNGFSLVRNIFGLYPVSNAGLSRRKLTKYYRELGETLAEALLWPTPIWISEVEEQRKRGVKFSGHAHITGGGMLENIPRILPSHCAVVIDRSRWARPPIFRLTQDVGAVSNAEMDKVFNQGIMMISIVHPSGTAMNSPDALLVGEVVRRKDADDSQVEMTGAYLDF